jgi:predicted RNA methylase
MKSKSKDKLGRRDFLRVMGAGAGLAAATAVPLADKVVAAESENNEKKARYNGNSEDVKNFYRVNRY